MLGFRKLYNNLKNEPKIILITGVSILLARWIFGFLILLTQDRSEFDFEHLLPPAYVFSLLFLKPTDWLDGVDDNNFGWNLIHNFLTAACCYWVSMNNDQILSSTDRLTDLSLGMSIGFWVLLVYKVKYHRKRIKGV